jgi:hypothetical protein
LQKCAACQDLLTLQFWSKSQYPFWSYFPCSNLDTFWFKIKQFWPFEEISIFSNGGHLGWLSDIILKGTYKRTIPARFGLIWFCGFTLSKLWTFVDFDRLCKLEKRGMKLFKNLLLWNYWANLNQTLLKWFLGGPLPKLCPVFQNTDQDGCHNLRIIQSKRGWNWPSGF